MGYALRWASLNGHTKCVKLLAPLSDVKSNRSQALIWSSFNGHAECVKILINLSDPKSDNSKALKLSAKNNHQNCIKLLLPYSDILKWNKEDWKYIPSDMQNFIKSYFSKSSLMDNITLSADKILKPKKLHKI